MKKKIIKPTLVLTSVSLPLLTIPFGVSSSLSNNDFEAIPYQWSQTTRKDKEPGTYTLEGSIDEMFYNTVSIPITHYNYQIDKSFTTWKKTNQYLSSDKYTYFTYEKDNRSLWFKIKSSSGNVIANIPVCPAYTFDEYRNMDSVLEYVYHFDSDPRDMKFHFINQYQISSKPLSESFSLGQDYWPLTLYSANFPTNAPFIGPYKKVISAKLILSTDPAWVIRWKDSTWKSSSPNKYDYLNKYKWTIDYVEETTKTITPNNFNHWNTHINTWKKKAESKKQIFYNCYGTTINSSYSDKTTNKMKLNDYIKSFNSDNNPLKFDYETVDENTINILLYDKSTPNEKHIFLKNFKVIFDDPQPNNRDKELSNLIKTIELPKILNYKSNTIDLPTDVGASDITDSPTESHSILNNDLDTIIKNTSDSSEYLSKLNKLADEKNKLLSNQQIINYYLRNYLEQNITKNINEKIISFRNYMVETTIGFEYMKNVETNSKIKVQQSKSQNNSNIPNQIDIILEYYDVYRKQKTSKVLFSNVKVNWIPTERFKKRNLKQMLKTTGSKYKKWNKTTQEFEVKEDNGDHIEEKPDEDTYQFYSQVKVSLIGTDLDNIKIKINDKEHDLINHQWNIPLEDFSFIKNDDGSLGDNVYKIEVIRYEKNGINGLLTDKIESKYTRNIIIKDSSSTLLDLKWYAWDPENNIEQKLLISPFLTDKDNKPLKDEEGNEIKNPKYNPNINPTTGTTTEIVWVNATNEWSDLPGTIYNYSNKKSNQQHKKIESTYFLQDPKIFNEDKNKQVFGFLAEAIVIPKAVLLTIPNNDHLELKRFYCLSSEPGWTRTLYTGGGKYWLKQEFGAETGANISLNPKNPSYFSTSGLWLYSYKLPNDFSNKFKIILIGDDLKQTDTFTTKLNEMAKDYNTNYWNKFKAFNDLPNSNNNNEFNKWKLSEEYRYNTHLLATNRKVQIYPKLDTHPDITNFWLSPQGKNLLEYLYKVHSFSPEKSYSLEYDILVKYWKLYVSENSSNSNITTPIVREEKLIRIASRYNNFKDFENHLKENINDYYTSLPQIELETKITKHNELLLKSPDDQDLLYELKLMNEDLNKISNYHTKVLANTNLETRNNSKTIAIKFDFFPRIESIEIPEAFLHQTVLVKLSDITDNKQLLSTDKIIIVPPTQEINIELNNRAKSMNYQNFKKNYKRLVNDILAKHKPIIREQELLNILELDTNNPTSTGWNALLQILDVFIALPNKLEKYKQNDLLNKSQIAFILDSWNKLNIKSPKVKEEWTKITDTNKQQEILNNAKETLRELINNLPNDNLETIIEFDSNISSKLNPKTKLIDSGHIEIKWKVNSLKSSIYELKKDTNTDLKLTFSALAKDIFFITDRREINLQTYKSDELEILNLFKNELAKLLASDISNDEINITIPNDDSSDLKVLTEKELKEELKKLILSPTFNYKTDTPPEPLIFNIKPKEPNKYQEVQNPEIRVLNFVKNKIFDLSKIKNFNIKLSKPNLKDENFKHKMAKELINLVNNEIDKYNIEPKLIYNKNYWISQFVITKSKEEILKISLNEIDKLITLVLQNVNQPINAKILPIESWLSNFASFTIQLNISEDDKDYNDFVNKFSFDLTNLKIDDLILNHKYLKDEPKYQNKYFSELNNEIIDYINTQMNQSFWINGIDYQITYSISGSKFKELKRVSPNNWTDNKILLYNLVKEPNKDNKVIIRIDALSKKLINYKTINVSNNPGGITPTKFSLIQKQPLHLIWIVALFVFVLPAIVFGIIKYKNTYIKAKKLK
ncbi:Mbov_0399 family ICE element protein [Mycoplasma crocodyli]|uniref:Uncharacterized protein n=1 Tax=Mycoplasma crocodyli (strain ATCC 51981 / MP145) TaxID=512564 RepID=D5E5P6_MYCCM|nr:hypothetical protein [Mycoplasma crocodyli]ADE19546.1 hypothetical protein MCRO_0463 [Mycoplasma crocodyli MP145]